MSRGALLPILLLSACAHQDPEAVRQALRLGELRRAEELAGGLDAGPERDELLGRIHDERGRAMTALLDEAALAKALGDAGESGYVAAITYTRAALSLASGPEAERLAATLGALELEQEARLGAFTAAHDAAQVAAGTCEPSRQRQELSDLAAKRVAADARVPIVPLAVRMARRCAEEERYREVLELREVVRTFESSDDHWPGEELAWLVIAEVRAGGPKRRSVVAQAVAPPPQPREPARATRARKETPPPAPEPEKKPSLLEPILAQARHQFTLGDTFVALTRLDEALKLELGAEEQAKLQAQLKEWGATRAALVEDYIKRGEGALRDEKTDEALGWYRKVLVLEPSHQLAQDRLRKLEKLQELRAGAKPKS